MALQGCMHREVQYHAHTLTQWQSRSSGASMGLEGDALTSHQSCCPELIFNCWAALVARAQGVQSTPVHLMVALIRARIVPL